MRHLLHEDFLPLPTLSSVSLFNPPSCELKMPSFNIVALPYQLGHEGVVGAAVAKGITLSLSICTADCRHWCGKICGTENSC